MKTSLVTGGFGFLGRALVRLLLNRGDHVRVLDDASRGTSIAVGELQCSPGQLEIIAGDVRHAEVVHRAARGVDSVCHLAFINGTEFFYARPAEVLEVGVKGMLHVLEACQQARVPELLLVSSSEVYQTPPVIPTDETTPLSIPDPLNPRYSYAGGKLISELLAINYGRTSFDRVLIVRPHNVYGPRMGQEHVVPQFINRMLAVKASRPTGAVPFPIQGDGQQTRAFLFIDDFVQGLQVVLDRGEHLNIYHVGTMEELTIADVAHQIAQCLGLRIHLVPGPAAPGGTLRRCPDIGKLVRLGFQPRYLFADGVQSTVDWYAAHPPGDGAATVALPATAAGVSAR